jgi:type IV pilus modification protein PilV
MEIQKLPHKTERGFTLLEVIVAISILTIGLVGVAALMTQMVRSTANSRYMSVASLLASEKLEDLNRYPNNDPIVWAPGGGTAGSLAANTSQSVTVGARTKQVAYFDEVQVSAGNGAITETVSGNDAGGNPIYNVTTHSPDGTVKTTQSATVPGGSGVMTFERRWVIEQDAPVTKVRRITVQVSLLNQPDARPFQTSLVRP